MMRQVHRPRWLLLGLILLGLGAACTPPVAETTVALNLGVTPGLSPELPPPPAANTCQVEVGRSDDTKHPNEGMQAKILELNDKFRALLGRDLFVGEDGGRAIIDCTIGAGHDAKATSQGVVVPVYQLTGMPPRNFFLTPERPGISGVVGHDGKALQLLPFQLPTSTKAVADFNLVADLLPKPNFSVAPLETGLPNAALSVVPGGTYQINNVLRMEIAPVDPAVSTNLAAGNDAGLGQAAIRLRQTVIVGPDGCAWAGCDDRVPNIQDRSLWHGQKLDPRTVIETLFTEVERVVAETKKAGKPVVAAEILATVFELVDYDVSNWLELRYHVISGVTTPEIDAALSAQLAAMEPNTALGFVRQEFTLPLLVVPPDYVASGGAGCSKGEGGCALLKVPGT